MIIWQRLVGMPLGIGSSYKTCVCVCVCVCDVKVIESGL